VPLTFFFPRSARQGNGNSRRVNVIKRPTCNNTYCQHHETYRKTQKEAPTRSSTSSPHIHVAGNGLAARSRPPGWQALQGPEDIGQRGRGARVCVPLQVRASIAEESLSNGPVHTDPN